MYVSMHVCVCVCVYVCMYVYLYREAWAPHIRTHIYYDTRWPQTERSALVFLAHLFYFISYFILRYQVASNRAVCPSRPRAFGSAPALMSCATMLFSEGGRRSAARRRGSALSDK